MNKICKIRPDQWECLECEDKTGCLKCKASREDYEIVGVYSKNYTGYAVIIKDGCLEDVELSTVYDVREKGGDGE